MIVSWNWLKKYVSLEMSPAELEHRLSMSGLNHEGTVERAGDLAIDLEVTSNRPDCLGHIGVARELSVLWDTPLKIPEVQLEESGDPASQLIDVSIEDLELCPQYTARVITGVKVGPSPDWLVKLLAAVGQPTVNNIVDITNFVLLETGQPLHAFDYRRLAGPKIVVRRARQGEQLEAIDHQTYALDSKMCVIADAERPVAIAGVMGGAGSEVDSGTVDLLIESAEFNQLATRTTSRQLKLMSESSHRFERGVDPAGVDWASQRCCQLVLELAGGTLAPGVVMAGQPRPPADPIVLRLPQLKRVLGIDIDPAEVARIVDSLGFQRTATDAQQITSQPPTWRRDCAREIDVIEEVARIHGYDKIPEDARVPMTASFKTPFDTMLDRTRQTVVGSGFHEAMTVTVTPHGWNEACNPWGATAHLTSTPSMLRGADELRHSIVPSLLNARKYNDARGNLDVAMFETSRVFVTQQDGSHEEPWMLALVSSQEFRQVKGVLETLGERLGCEVTMADGETPGLLAPGRSAWLALNGTAWGYVGEVSDESLKQFGLQRGATVAEVRLQPLADQAELIPQDKALSPHPAMSQDLNFIVPESLTWRELQQQVRAAGGELLESVAYKETYIDAQQDGPGRKRLLLTIVLRKMDSTLTGEEAEAIRQRIIDALQKIDAQLLS